MTQFVRPTSSRNHSAKKRQISRSFKQINWRPWIIVGLIVSVVAIVGWLVDWLFVRNERYQMRQIDVIHSGAALFAQLPDQKIVDQIQWKHYYLTKSRRVLPKIEQQYSLISSLDLESTETLGHYRLTIAYKPVQMALRRQDRDYGLVDGELYPLSSGSWLPLKIPLYFTGMLLSGLFYEIPAQQLVKQYQAIVRGLEDKDIQWLLYHPAARQIQVNTPKQEIYFDIGGNIFEQLKKYRSMLEQQQKIPNQRVVDLGAIEKGVFVYP
jgi:hypothetical protein